MAGCWPTLVAIEYLTLASLFSHVLAQPCSHGEIRMARNSTPFEGGIDVCVNNSVWGTVCNDFWGTNEIQVACRQLGFQVTGSERFIDLLIDGGPDVVIDNINCTGREQSLVDCSFSFEVSDCLGDITHKVGVRCHEERPPQNVSVTALASVLNVTWGQPLSGITNEPVLGYNIECTSTVGSNDILTYKVRGATSSISTSILMQIDNSPFVPVSVYNCCMEVEYETYSSIACAMARKYLGSPTTFSEVSSIDEQTATVSNTSAIGGALGATIVILTLLLVMSLLGMLYMYRRMNLSEGVVTVRKRTLSSTSDGAEHVVDNPTYGENESIDCHTADERVEQYSTTGPDYEAIDRELNTGECYTSLDEAIVNNVEEVPFDQTSIDSVQI